MALLAAAAGILPPVIRRRRRAVVQAIKYVMPATRQRMCIYRLV